MQNLTHHYHQLPGLPSSWTVKTLIEKQQVELNELMAGELKTGQAW